MFPQWFQPPGPLNIVISLSPALEAWVKVQTSTTTASLARIEAALAAILTQEKKTLAALDDSILSLTAQVKADTDATSAATLMISGIAAQIAAAVAAAQAAGATPTQLAALNALQANLKANDDSLGAAVTANTVAAP